jgi:hypothetical protein
VPDWVRRFLAEGGGGLTLFAYNVPPAAADLEGVIVVETGYVATYGASRASLDAVAEALS